jgi:two-component system CheB/CheR fusion protein
MYTQVILYQLEKTGLAELITPVTKINSQIDRLTLLIDNMLNITKLQVGKLELHEEMVDMQQLIEDAIAMVDENQLPSQITLKGKINRPTSADKEQMSRVLINLIGNALKYSPSDKKVIVKIEEKATQLSISIKDFGMGIDKEQQKKIFDRFYRVPGKNEKTFPGLGVGLYFSSKIIKRHGGKLEVKSTIGKGSEFIFTLPFRKPPKRS